MSLNQNSLNWVLFVAACAIGGVEVVFALGQLMFPKTDMSGIATRLAVAGGIGGCVLGVIAGMLTTLKDALRWLGLAASPLFAFGALLIPGVLKGTGVGIALWWLGAFALFALGSASCWITRRLRGT